MFFSNCGDVGRRFTPRTGLETRPSVMTGEMTRKSLLRRRDSMLGRQRRTGHSTPLHAVTNISTSIPFIYSFTLLDIFKRPPFPLSFRLRFWCFASRYIEQTCGFAPTVTQNFCLHTAKCTNIQLLHTSSRTLILWNTNHGKPKENSSLQLLIPLNCTLLISELLHRLKVFYYVRLMFPLFQPIMYV